MEHLNYLDFFSKINNLLLLGLATLSGISLAWPNLTKNPNELTASAATELINRNNAIIIDVRTYAEFITGHLAQARNIPLDTLLSKLSQQDKSDKLNKLVKQDKLAQLPRNKDNYLLVLCQAGVRSHQACSALNKAGYKKVFSLSGGLAAWQRAELPLVK